MALDNKTTRKVGELLRRKLFGANKPATQTKEGGVLDQQTKATRQAK